MPKQGEVMTKLKKGNLKFRVFYGKCYEEEQLFSSLYELIENDRTVKDKVLEVLYPHQIKDLQFVENGTIISYPNKLAEMRKLKQSAEI